MYAGMRIQLPPDIERLLGAAADRTRLRILGVLERAPGRELCVCELVDILQEPQYNVSRHLRVLADAGMVTGRPEGRWVYYRVSADLAETRAFLRFLRSVGSELDLETQRRLRQRLGLRESGACVVGVRDPSLLSRRRSRGR